MPEINVDKVKKIAPLGAAGVLGLAAAGIGWMLVSQSEKPSGPSVASVEFDEIVVAARSLPAGYALTGEDLSFLKIEARLRSGVGIHRRLDAARSDRRRRRAAGPRPDARHHRRHALDAVPPGRARYA